MSVIRRGLIILVLLSCLCGHVCAQDIMGIGDSIALGQCSGNVGPWPELATLRGLSETTYNAGVGGNSAAQVDARIGDLLTSVDPTLTVVIVGSNDVRWLGTSLSSYLASIASINTKIVNSGSTSIICQITPVTVMSPYDYGRNETGQQNTKLWNAALEEWCYTNNVPMSANYQECAYNDVAHEDDLYYDSTCGDGVHISYAGYTRIATLLNNASVPNKTRTWGSTSFPNISNESWDWWILTGSASISGDADTGTLNLTTGDTAVSNVLCIDSDGGYIGITSNATGTVSYKYRTSSTNFNRNNSEISWTDYTTTFQTTDQFIQIQAVSSSATVADITLDWDSSAPTASPSIANGGVRNGGFR